MFDPIPPTSRSHGSLVLNGREAFVDRRLETLDQLPDPIELADRIALVIQKRPGVLHRAGDGFDSLVWRMAAIRITRDETPFGRMQHMSKVRG